MPAGHESPVIISTFPIGPEPWICERCEQWITDRDDDVGVILIARTPRVTFHVYHSRCTTADAHSDTYRIQTSRATSVEQWVGWLLHLGKQSWMTPRDQVNGIRFWCERHGLEIPGDPT